MIRVGKNDLAARKKTHDDEFGFFAPPDSSDIWIGDFEDGLSTYFHDKVHESFTREPTRPIPIYIDSSGGYTSELLAIMDIMDEVRAQAPDDFYFITYALGKAYSCGAFLLAHGDFRIKSPKASVMFHQISGGAVGHAEDIEISAKDVKETNTKLLEIFADDTKFKGGVDAVKKKMGRDWYVTNEEAVKYNIVEEVGYLSYNRKVFYEVGIKTPGDNKKKANTLRRPIVIGGK